MQGKFVVSYPVIVGDKSFYNRGAEIFQKYRNQVKNKQWSGDVERERTNKYQAPYAQFSYPGDPAQEVFTIFFF